MNSPSIIRVSLPEDFLRIAALDRSGWSQNRNTEFVPDGEHVWRIWCEHALTSVALMPDDPDGIGGVVVAFPCKNSTYCLHKIIVDQNLRGRGIGTELMSHLLSRIDELDVALFLTVDPKNAKALELYERAGFTGRRHVASYYRNHEDRYVLTRPPGGRQS